MNNEHSLLTSANKRGIVHLETKKTTQIGGMTYVDTIFKFFKQFIS